MKPIIEITNLSKKYRIGAKKRYLSLREELSEKVRRVCSRLSPLRSTLSPSSEDFWALKDISFAVQEGEAVGIIGRNGAGKSTLLKVLSQITPPTEGKITLRGRVASLLEVGTGFHPELTGRENIYLNGAILGMNRAEIKSKFDEIVAFAEIEQFLETPVKRYSSGMYVRLAFAVAAHLEPEILVIDEVLAVGDAEFQKKCLGKMRDVTKDNRTVLFVSHNIATIKALCSRAILLSHGELKEDGSPENITKSYLSSYLANDLTFFNIEPDENLRVQVLHAEIADNWGDNTILRCKYIVRKPLKNLVLGIFIHNAFDICVFYSNDDQLADTRKRKCGIHIVELSIPKYLFAPGDYYVALGFWEPGHTAEHVPIERLFFNRGIPNDRLAAHGIAWPSVLCLPATWNYIAGEQ
jgi:lipopolysaccharide transport system ATP-binding protein